METNVGLIDAWIRGVLAVAALVLAAVFNEFPSVSLGAAVLALLLMGSALTKYCPLYRLLHIHTNKPQHPHSQH